jgi:phage repressor protein C with HTH and peptisase S24 domain
VFYYRCPDDQLAGYRIHAGDLLLTVPEKTPVDEAVMIVERMGLRVARKVKKLDGGKLLLQSFDREFRAETVDLKAVLILGRCVKLRRSL